MRITVVAVVLAAAVLAGCNTMRGMGQDISKAGTAIENAAAKK